MSNPIASETALLREPKVYAASRASVPERPAMWKRLRAKGRKIVSSWIDEAEPGATADLGELWARIVREIASSDRLVLYVEPNDFPLKGAFIEVGIALGMGKPVFVVAPDCKFEAPSFRPIGSWIKHPLVKFSHNFIGAFDPIADTQPASDPSGKGAREWLETESPWKCYQIGDERDPDDYMMAQRNVIECLEAYAESALTEQTVKLLREGELRDEAQGKVSQLEAELKAARKESNAAEIERSRNYDKFSREGC